MAYRKIVVGTDGSPTAGVAQRTAARLAKRLRAQLILVCAYEQPRLSRPMAEGLLRQATQDARSERVEAIAEMRQGEAVAAILDAAERHSADLIVLGNKGMGQPRRFRLGSVPDQVAHSAPCDVLIVDTTKSPPAEERPGRLYTRIVAGTDGSPTAGEAARTAFELAMVVGASVNLVYVGDPIVGAILLEQTAGGRPDGVKVENTVLEGEPAEAIPGLAEARGADLIVVGNKGMRGARRMLGSVPNTVAHRAPSSVLIVRTVDRSIDDVEPGHGAIVEVDGHRVAVYKDETGALHTVSPRCTHMGCTVGWNDSEATWDCPCHGSRFSHEGEVIRGPATKPLAPVDLNGKALAKRTTDGRKSPRAGSERFLIVGASLAGGTAAATFRREGFDGSVVLVGAEAHLPYERPPLSKAFLRGETTFEDALVEPEVFYEDNDIELRVGSRATAVDPDRRTVTLEGGERIRYDRLLVTTGARNRRFPIPGLDLAGVYGIRTVEDAERIRADMRHGARAVVAGMGFIGSEVTASFRRSGIEVTVVDGGDVPLGRVLGEQVGGVLEAIHRDQGVRMFFRDRVAAFQGGSRVERVLTAGGVSLDCDFAVVGLGVEPVTDLMDGSGVEIDNGIVVDELCRTNVDRIYAAGDVANHRHPLFGRRLRVEHWQNALKQGNAAALSMLGKGAPYQEVHWFWSDQYDDNLQYAGFHTDFDRLAVRGRLEDREFVAFYLKGGRVQAVVGLNRGDDVSQSMALIRAASPVDPARLEDPSVDLESLAGALAGARSAP